jgi:aldose 1-epimerase
MKNKTMAVAAAVALAATTFGAGAASNYMKASVTKASFGRLTDGTEIEQYTLTNAKGASCKVITYGGRVTELQMPDRAGKLGDIVLGYDKLDNYLAENPYFGAAIGRYGNRIAKAKFKLEGKAYSCAVNNGPNSLHGGIKGFDKVVWKAEIVSSLDGAALKLTYFSKDGEEGYPGNLTVTMIYTLTDMNELRFEYMATTDKTTVINLTNHSYFNLAGEGDILGHVVWIDADRFTPVDETLIPTGELKKLKGSVMDFTKPMTIGSRLGQLTNNPQGYDHNYVLNSGGKKLALAARVEEPKTGRTMEVYTTEPGLQFYTGNFLDGTLIGKNGVVYKQHYAFCMETDHFPDSPNQPKFPTTVLKPGQTYRQTTVYKFAAK